MSLKVKLNYPDARAPERSYAYDAGVDVFAYDGGLIRTNSRRIFDTGISVACPRDCYVRVAPRSGLAVRQGLDVLAGVIDSGYRGKVKVILQNNGEDDYEVKKGDKIAQLIMEKIYTSPVEVVEDLDDTDRGEGGFGSTGV